MFSQLKIVKNYGDLSATDLLAKLDLKVQNLRPGTTTKKCSFTLNTPNPEGITTHLQINFLKWLYIHFVHRFLTKKTVKVLQPALANPKLEMVQSDDMEIPAFHVSAEMEIPSTPSKPSTESNDQPRTQSISVTHTLFKYI